MGQLEQMVTVWLTFLKHPVKLQVFALSEEIIMIIMPHKIYPCGHTALFSG